MKILFTVASAAFAVIAAALWFRSGTVLGKPTVTPDESGFVPFQIIRKKGKKEWEVLATAEAQTKWNKWASIAAFAAASFQAAALLTPDSK